MNAEELGNYITQQSFGTVISFGGVGATCCSEECPEYLQASDIAPWFGCYTVKGPLDNECFIVDDYGGGSPMIFPLSSCITTKNGIKLDSYSIEVIKDAAVEIFDSYDEISDYVYVEIKEKKFI